MYFISSYVQSVCITGHISLPCEQGVKTGGRRINNLKYADGTVLLAENRNEMKWLVMRDKDGSAKRMTQLTVKKIKLTTIDEWYKTLMLAMKKMKLLKMFYTLVRSTIQMETPAKKKRRQRAYLGGLSWGRLDRVAWNQIERWHTSWCGLLIQVTYASQVTLFSLAPKGKLHKYISILVVLRGKPASWSFHLQDHCVKKKLWWHISAVNLTGSPHGFQWTECAPLEKCTGGKKRNSFVISLPN